MTRSSKNLATALLALAIFACAFFVARYRLGRDSGEWFNCTAVSSLAILLIHVLASIIWHMTPWQRHLRLLEFRRTRNLCMYCGYNLRAHRPGDKCPECGTLLIPTPAPATMPPEQRSTP